MRYHLSPQLSFGIIGSRAVLLDLTADRYFLLGEAETETLVGLGEGRQGRAERVAALAARGIIREGNGSLAPVAAPEPHASALETLERSIRLPVREAAAARAGAALRLRFRGLSATVAYWRALRGRLAARPGLSYTAAILDPAADVARGYAAARIFVPARRLCVPDSLAIAKCLWRRGFDADIYFGVRLAPFAAHCWVQKDALVLSDPLNIVADYVPVFRL